jgi:chaperone required for assembly of F1-ATPase
MKWRAEDDAALARMRFRGSSVGSMASLLGRERADVQQRVTLHEWQEEQWGHIQTDTRSSAVVLQELRALNRALTDLERMVDRLVGPTPAPVES